jgi:hypothetical protein
MARPRGHDELLGLLDAGRILMDLSVYRCRRCGLVRVLAAPMLEPELHRRCAGRWAEVESISARAVVLRVFSCR